MLAGGGLGSEREARRGGDLVIPCSYRGLARDARRGHTIFIDDGRIRLAVEETRGEKVVCRVEAGGTLTSNKGMNLPGVPLRVPTVTSKDLEDLAFGLRQGVDFVAVSFVRRGRGGGGAQAPAGPHRSGHAGHREDREARGHRRSGRDPGGRRRSHGCAGRPGRGVPAREGAPSPEGDHRAGQRGAQAGHYGDADARIDDLKPQADAGRGLRRGKRRLRRDGRRDALGRDGGGKVSRGGGPGDGQDRPRGGDGTSPRRREERSEAGGDAVRRRGRHDRRRADRPPVGGPGDRRLLPVGAHGAAGGLVPAGDPRVRFHAAGRDVVPHDPLQRRRSSPPLFHGEYGPAHRFGHPWTAKGGEGEEGDRLVFIMGAPPSRRGTTNLLKLHEA